MFRHGVHPLGERRVKLGDDASLPFWSDKAEQKFRLVGGVLVQEDEWLAMSTGLLLLETYYCTRRKRKDSEQPHKAVGEGYQRRSPRWLLEGESRVGGRPVLVVALSHRV